MSTPENSPRSKNSLVGSYAHSLAGCGIDEWQTLHDHSRAVAAEAARFAGPFKSEEWAAAAGWLHDIGKADERFQRYLRKCNGLDDFEYDNGLDDFEFDNGSKGRVNHSSAGAALALEHYGEGIGKILAYITAGHHAGLPDWYPDKSGRAALRARLQEGRSNLDRIRAAASAVTAQLGDLKPPFAFTPQSFHFWIRMVFSCLVDADYLDTEKFMQGEQAQLRCGYSSIAALKSRFDSSMAELIARAEPAPVNNLRAKILNDCRLAGKDPNPLRSLTVPTGGGKTLSAMAFALEHCGAFGKRRIIYVIPYTSVIEQTAQVLAVHFGSENVLEHHSNLDPKKETQRSRLAAENWDAPVIVTTTVQFFESLYASKPGRCRKLHNLCDSVVILDEVQLLPVKLLSPCIAALKNLAADYNTTIVFSTATQPALGNVPKGCCSVDDVSEIIPDPDTLYQELRRVEYRLPVAPFGPENWEDVAIRLQEHDSVLCIVNSRRDCYDLFRLMPQGTIHLSALMCGEHRSRVIAEIKERLRDDIPTRVISTQLVEAGVDVDFPVVYRAMAGLDSLAQAAGRCNREGRLATGEVHVFVPPKPSPPGILRKADDAARDMVRCGVNLHDPKTFRQFFEKVYSSANDTGATFLALLEKGAPDGEFSFRTAAKQLKLIEETQRPVIVRYGDAETWLSKLRHAGPSREVTRGLQRYVVNLHQRSVDEMLRDGRLALANAELAPDIVVQNAIRYDDLVGLDVFAESLPAENLIV